MPRARSTRKRVKVTSTNNSSSDVGTLDTTPDAGTKDDETMTAQHAGFLDLPVELCDMIFESLWHDCEDITREAVLRNYDILQMTHATKEDTLRPLSQVCRTLRDVFLPRLWEHMQACVVRTEGRKAFHKILGERLERLSKGLLQTPNIARHVRIFTVSITKYQAATILTAWADCLENLPNLHTVQIMCASAQITTPLKQAFEGRKFPQIRMVVLPDCAHNFLRACPEVTEVICNEQDGGKLVTAIAAACKKVEIVQDITPKPPILKRLLKAAPRLREYRVNCCATRHSDPKEGDVAPGLLCELSAFKELSVLSITVATDDAESQTRAYTTEEHINAAKIALRENKFNGPKQLRVNYAFWDREAGPYSGGEWKIVRDETLHV